MLRRLALNHFVIVEHIEIELDGGFCVLTGETGAGKSLLVGALALLAGGRATAAMVRPPAPHAHVEAVFDIAHHDGVKQYLQDYDLAAEGDEADTLIVRRVIGGRKNAVYINGHSASLAQLGELMAPLIDICGQHAHYSLRSTAAHRRLLDEYAGADSAAVAAAYQQWRSCDEQYQAARHAAGQVEETRAMLTEILGELNALNFSADKWRQMNETLTRTANISDLLHGCAEIVRGLQGDEDGGGGVQAGLAQVRRHLQAMQRHDADLSASLTTVEEADALLSDLLRDISRYAERLNDDPQAQEAADVFIADCHRAARKYRLADPAQLGEFIGERQRELESLPTAADIEQRAAAAAAARQALEQACGVLSRQRRLAAKKLTREVNATLHRLSMPKARLSVALTPQAQPGAHGSEKVAFEIVTRANMAPGSIAEVASGGELSRLGLAIQIAAGKVRGCAVSVFDEVDAGIGGSAAGVVGGLLRQLGENRQVLCVTHLAQVAAKAHAHWRVIGGDSLTVQPLSLPARVEEIARMQSGEVITESARSYAAELLGGSGR